MKKKWNEWKLKSNQMGKYTHTQHKIQSKRIKSNHTQSALFSLFFFQFPFFIFIITKIVSSLALSFHNTNLWIINVKTQREREKWNFNFHTPTTTPNNLLHMKCVGGIIENLKSEIKVCVCSGVNFFHSISNCIFCVCGEGVGRREKRDSF